MSCVICDSEAFQFLFEKNNCRIEKCSICGMVQVTNMPPREQVEDGYDEDFFEEYYKGLECNQKKQRYVYLNFHNKVDQIEKRIRERGKIMDVGCSFGFFMDAARQRGWTVTGIDVSKYAADYATQRLGLLVENKTIMEAKFADFVNPQNPQLTTGLTRSGTEQNSCLLHLLLLWNMQINATKT